MMNPKKVIFQIITLLAVISFVYPRKALAYLDPGSGSYLIQMLIAGAVGFGFILRNYWKKLKDIFKKKTDDQEK